MAFVTRPANPSKRRVVPFFSVRWGGAAFVLAPAALTLGAGCFDFGSVSGGSPRTDGGSSDGSVPGSTGGGEDAGPPSSGSGDAGTGGGTLGFCGSISPTPSFCDDFDEYDGSTLTLWDQPLQYNGSIGLTSLSPFSKPNAMTAQTNIAATGEQTEADVLKAFPTYATKGIAISVAFEMNIVQWDPTATIGQIIAFEFIFKNSTAQFNQIVINLNSQGPGGVTAQVAENAMGVDGGPAGYNSYPFQTHPVTNAWTKVEVTLSVPNPSGTQSNTVTVKMGGVTQVDAQALEVPIQGGTPYLHLGIGYVATPASAAWVVHYDDFVATITPF